MADYKVLIKPSAVKEVEAIPAKDRERVVRKIRTLTEDPRPRGSEKLSGDALEECERQRTADPIPPAFHRSVAAMGHVLCQIE